MSAENIGTRDPSWHCPDREGSKAASSPNGRPLVAAGHSVLRPPANPMRTLVNLVTVLVALTLPPACSSGGGGGTTPARINSSPTMVAPPGVGGAFPVYEYEVSAGAAAALTFGATDIDGDQIQWRASPLVGEAAAGGVSFPTESTGSITFTITSVPNAALLIVAMTMSDGQAESTAFLTVSRTTAPVTPSLAGLTRDSAYGSQPQRLTLTGSGFIAGGAGTNLVTIGANPAAGVVAVSDERIDCATPIATSTGPADVGLLNANGVAAPLRGALTYFTFPPRWQALPTRAGTGSQYVALARDGAMSYYAAAGSGGVFFGRSSDRGATWTEQTLEPPGLGGTMRGIRIAASAGAVHVVWLRTGVVGRSSTDRGATFRPATGLSRSFSPAPSTLELVADGDIACVLFDTSVSGLMAAGSTDRGSTWSDPSAVANRDAPSLAIAGNRVHAAYVDATNGGVYYNHSVDGGASWQAVDVQVGSTGRKCSVAADADDVYVAWADRGRLYVARSADRGQTTPEVMSFSPPVRDRTTLFDDQDPPALALDSGVAHVAVCWSESATLGGITVVSTAPGALPTRTEASGPAQAALRLAVSGDYRHLVWSSGAAGTTRVFTSSWATADGGRWLAPLRVTTSASDETGPDLQADSARLIAAWVDGNGASVASSVTQ